MAKINHWISKVADQVEHFVERRKGPGAKIITSSGISPSGVIHLGNLREIFTVHLINEELLRRGRDAEHLHFWDDYDRFRKVPSNVPADFEKYIGQPLSEIPDPEGELESYGARFMKQFEEQVAQFGVKPTYVRQSDAYKAGEYTERVKEAMEMRLEISDVLGTYMSDEKQAVHNAGRDCYYPFQVYCGSCLKDETEILSYQPDRAEISYKCNHCAHEETYSLNDKSSGKLKWKIDWPMRWHHCGVDFEPGGVDHATPGSSYTVGKDLVKRVYNDVAPHFVGYSFVGIAGGSSKISSSSGTAATPENAVAILEPAILRWLYIRADVRASFTINFDDQVMRLYDEWDRFVTKVKDGKASDKEVFVYEHCVKTSAGEVAHSKVPVPFRLISSSYEITKGNVKEIARIITHHSDHDFTEESFLEEVGLRYSKVSKWVDVYQEDELKLNINDSFRADIYAELDDEQKTALQQLVDTFEDHLTLDGLTTLFYGIPKKMLDFPPDTKPTDELKQLQRKFFVAVYKLITGTETGPRLPTLVLSLGSEKVKALLSAS